MATSNIDWRVRTAPPPPSRDTDTGYTQSETRTAGRGPRPVRLVTNGVTWRVEVLRRSWRLLGQRCWRKADIAWCHDGPISRSAIYDMYDEEFARKAFALVVSFEKRLHEDRMNSWRTVFQEGA